jgi:hypothetical protein
METTTMDTRKKKALKALAVFLAFSFAQVYVQAGLPSPATPARPPQQLIARLTTTGNRSILVNGNSVGTGGSILTGATIETPDQVGATIDLGDAGVIELQPGSKIQLDWDENGNVRVNVIKGCAVARKKTNVLPGEIQMYTYTTCETTDKTRRNMGFCITPNGGLSPFSVSGVSGGEIGAIVGGIIGPPVLVDVLTRGANTSPTR